MEVMYDYQAYPIPKTGIFKCPHGLLDIEKERVIIGEDKDTYVYELLHIMGGGEWTDEGKTEDYPMILPLGLHKSRLVKWTNTTVSIQLQLF